MSSISWVTCCDEQTGTDLNYCRCSDITDSESFEFCVGNLTFSNKSNYTLNFLDPRPDALLVVAGDETEGPSSSVEILVRNVHGEYEPRSPKGCYKFPNNTSSATGAVYNDLPTICAGYVEGDPSRECYKLSTTGQWNSAFQLNRSLIYGGASILFDAYENITHSSWVFVGGDPDGVSTQVLEDNTINATMLDLPLHINMPPCMAKINNTHGFLIAEPTSEFAPTNFAWILNRESWTWTRLSNSQESHSGPACGFIQNTAGRFIVVAGGYESSTTELLNLDTLEWSPGPTLPGNVYGGSLVSVMDEQELVLVGGYDTAARSQILRLDSTMDSWIPAGNLSTPRFSSVALGVPVEDLPQTLNLPC